MFIFRLSTIVLTTFRFGLDEIIARQFSNSLFCKIWLRLGFWRPLRKPRGERLRDALEYLGPIFVKFGQVISTRRDILPSDIASELAKLQDAVTPQPFSQIRQVIEASYQRPVTKVFASIEETPLGSASVAQVHKAILQDGTPAAVKVLRPNIHHAVGRDIALMESFAWMIEKLFTHGPRLRPREIVAEFHRSLLEETDLLHEAANCNQLRRNFSDHQMLVMPAVYWQYCTSSVMVMELLEGTPIDQIEDLKAANVDLARLAATGIEVFFTEVFRDSFFHADMHPGNLLVDDQGRFVLLDFGIVGSLSEFDKQYIGANFLAFFNRDYRKVAVMHVEAGWTPSDTSIPQFEAAIRSVCEPIFARPLNEISFGRLLLQLFRVAQRFNLIVQPQLILLQKTLLNIEGVGRQLAPGLNLWDSAKPLIEKWAREQNSPMRVVDTVKDGFPTLVSLLPELPQAARALLLEIKHQDVRKRYDLEHLRRRQRQLWIVIAVLLAVLVSLNL